MSAPKSVPPGAPTPEDIRKFLRDRFQAMPEEDVRKMRELQGTLRKYVPEGVSLADEIIDERRKEGGGR